MSPAGKSPLSAHAAIVGVGLIGGSMAMAWKRRGLVGRITGVDRDPSVCRQALAEGIVDTASQELAAVVGADLVVLAAPVGEILDLAPRLTGLVKPGSLVTDVGSTKRAIVAATAELAERGAIFVGGHPMAGSEERGLAAADPFLFENAIYALTPAEAAPRTVLERLEGLVRGLGAHPLILSPEAHDHAVALVSHLPQLVAVSLIRAAASGSGADQPLGLAAGGFRDTTRIAASPPELWDDILLTNREPVLEAVETFQRELERLAAALREGEREPLHGLMEEARRVRAELPRHRRGLMPQMFDLVAVVPDRPGELGRISVLLGGEGINIRDVEVLHVREGEGGSIRFAFTSAADARGAARVLEAHDYRVRLRDDGG